MQKLPLKILGIGRYVPSRVVSNAEVEALCQIPAGWIERHSGVKERRWVQGETATEMGAFAATAALHMAGLSASQLDLIVNASGTPEQTIPDSGPLLQRHLGLGGSGMPAFSIHATCLSFLVALDTTANLLASGRYERVLIVSSDVGSAGLNFAERESASLMGDAAVAVVVGRAQPGDPAGVLAARLETYGDGAYLTTINGGGSRKHPNRPETLPEDNLFHMDGPQVLRMAIKYGPGFLERLAPGLSTSLLDIDWVTPHQASRMGLRTLQAFNWSSERIVTTLEQYGNCIAASIPLTLYEAITSGRLQRGQKVLMVGTGAGLSIGGMILVY
jgi:3-oxoacyl-[acyl-carrier-protein] synthase-3